MSVGSDSARDVDPEGYEGGIGPGSIVAGKYRVEKKLGAGGMGVVVAARHMQLNHLVAIKFLHAGEPDGTDTARFLREARAAAALRSEHVARVIDVGTLETGKPFMVMEHLEGQNLSKLIRKHAPMPVAEAAALMLQACDALGEAHARGIVHRDVKPSNMFLTKRNDGSTSLKVLDFGISKAPLMADHENEPTLTKSQVVLGSPQYLSPEQFADVRTVDCRTDIWALGVVLYYMLCGRRPFQDDTLTGLYLAIATEQPPRLLELRPDVPREIDDIVMRCLEKDREHRVASAAELASALAPFAASTARVAVENIGVVPPDSRSAAELNPLSQSLPHAPTELAVRRPDSQTSLIVVQAARRTAPAAWLQVGAAVTVVGVLALLLVSRSSSTPPRDLGGVVPASGAEKTPLGGAAASPTQQTGDSSEQPPERTVLVPGSAKPVAQAPKPKSSGPDFGRLLGANMVGTAQATLRLLDSVGGQNVIGVVPNGEIVMVKRVAGEWALVTYVNESRAVTGWTLRNLVQ